MQSDAGMANRQGTSTCTTVNTLAWLDGEVRCDMTMMEKRCGAPVHGNKDKDDLGELVNIAFCTPLHPCCLCLPVHSACYQQSLCHYHYQNYSSVQNGYDSWREKWRGSLPETFSITSL